MSSAAAPQTKTFGKATRTVPHSSEKAQKWYPAEDEAQPRKVRSCTSFHEFSGRPATILAKYREMHLVELRRNWHFAIWRPRWGQMGRKWRAAALGVILDIGATKCILMEATTRGGQAAKTPNMAKTTSSNIRFLYRSARPSASGLPAAPLCPAPS